MKKILVHVLALIVCNIHPLASVYSQEQITASTAMQHYLDNNDTSFRWQIKDSFTIQGVQGYDLLLTSQKWREYTWTHQLTLFIPKQNTSDGALLFITGGSV